MTMIRVLGTPGLIKRVAPRINGCRSNWDGPSQLEIIDIGVLGTPGLVNAAVRGKA